MNKELVGQTLLNQFRVDAFVGSGGMAEVYRVWDLDRGVPLAMKVLRANLAEDPSIMKRFQREARALKKLAHPNIVPFYGLFQTLDIIFLMVRFIDGPSLDDVLRDRKTLSIEESLIYLKALSSALGYAHRKGVVHCDVKPGNVLIDGGGNIYLTDFGIARHAESTTTTIASAGTPAYMPPEQILGEAVSPATDVYSLGVMLFKMLTGKTPFHSIGAGTEQSGSTAKERVRYGHLHLAPPDPREINPSVTSAVAEVLKKALSKDPLERYRTVPEFFESVCKSAEVSPDKVAALLNPSTLPQKDLTTNGEQLIAGDQILSPRQNLSRIAIVGATVLMIVVVAGIFVLLPNVMSPAASNPGTPTIELATSTPIVTATLIMTATTIPTSSPVGPPPINEFNYQDFDDLYSWEVGSDVIKITGVAISYKTQQVALLVQRYPEGYALELRDVEGNLKWEASLAKAAYPAIAISPDGSLIATGTDDGNVRIWRSSDGSLVHDLSGHRFPVRIVAFSPDGMMVASGGSDNTARIWMVAGGMARRVYDNKTDVRDIAFSSDSHYLAVSANVVVVLDTTTNESIGNIHFYDSQGDTQALGEVAFSSDGKRIASSGDWFNVENGRWRKRIMVWDFPSGLSSATRIPIDDAIEDLVFSEDGNLIMGVLKDRGKLQIYSIADREVFGEIDIGSKLLMSYSPDLRMFVVISTRTSVTVWGIAQ